MLLLDIPVTEQKTETDREVFFSDLKFADRDIPHFVQLDTYIDYMRDHRYSEYLSELKKREYFKVCAEYFPVTVDKLHSVSIRKQSYIIRKGQVTSSLPFAVNVYYGHKNYKWPPNASLVLRDFKLIPLFNLSHGVFSRDLNKSLILADVMPNSTNELYDLVTKYSSVGITPIDISDISEYYYESKKPFVHDLNFLTSKPVSNDTLSMRYSFDIDNQNDLLEDIFINGPNKHQLDLLKMRADESLKYDIISRELAKETLRLSRLEHMCKVKFPNLFNPANKEFTFADNFDLHIMKEWQRTALLKEYQSKIDYESKLITNKCEHRTTLKKLRESQSKEDYNQLKSFIIDADQSCGACGFDIACKHELKFFELLFTGQSQNKIGQQLSSEFATPVKSGAYASFCKLCGMKIMDLINTDGINYEDNNYHNAELSDDNKLVLSTVLRNLEFSKPVSKGLVFQISDNIWESISNVLMLIGKKKMPNKDRELAIVVMTIVSIAITEMGTSFIRLARVVRNKKYGGLVIKKSTRNTSDIFRSCWDLFKFRYSKLLSDSSYKGKDELAKQLFIKSYSLLKDSIDSYSESETVATESTHGDYKQPKDASEYQKMSYEIYTGDDSHGVKAKELESQLIQLQVSQNNYPLSQLPYSYKRYYNNDKWSKDMGLYACPETGKRHQWNNYIFGDSEVAINKISSDNPPTERVTDMRCKNCKLTTSQLIKSNKDIQKTVEDKVNLLNDIDSFYFVYRYRCFKKDFHDFTSVVSSTEKCKHCGMLFSDIANKDLDFYLEHKEDFRDFNAKLSYEKNQLLSVRSIPEYTLANPVKPELSIDPELQNIGKSESNEEVDYMSSEMSNPDTSDTFLKILDRIRQIVIIVGLLMKKPGRHKFVNEFDESVPSSLHAELLNAVSSIWDCKKINPEKSTDFARATFFDILTKLRKEKELYSFIVSKLKESELVFTNYNYSELKKSFNLSKLAEKSFEESIDETFEEIQDDFDLFDTSDLSMNNYADDDIDA
jgi:hypothetical protein